MKLYPLFALPLLIVAQAPQAKVEFEVASIKPNKSTSTGSSVSQNNGLWRVRNNTTRSLIQSAFDILPEQITGAPAWVDSDRFDIEAKFEKPPGKEDTGERVLALLESRFQMQWHRETKEWQAYVLLPGKKGPKLTPSAKKEGSSTRINNGHMECTGVSMDTLARSLAGRLGRPVSNQTGLEGRFDFTLDFDPENQQIRMSEKEGAFAGVDNKNPSLFTALQDQLGLRLETHKAPVSMLVVDRIEHPTEN